MPDWRDRPHRRRRRPPWWPEGEAWPPQGSSGAEGWRRMRARMFWRIGVALAYLLIFGVAVGSVLVWALSRPWAGAIVAAVVVVGLLRVVGSLRRAAAPVADLVAAAARVEAGDYSARLAEHGPREIRAVTRAFNAMNARLEESDEQRRRLLADLSHELRTPLSVIQGNLEGLIDGVYPADEAHLAPILEETHVLERLIEDLRTLALAEAGRLRMRLEPTDLAALLGDIVAAFAAQADAAGVELVVDASGDLSPVEIDPARIREVIANLLTNALRHTPRDGRIEIVARGADGGVSVSVNDTGSGIAPEALPHVFDRFYRAGGSSGSGLGLPIARSLVAAHGGEMSASSEPGGGTRMVFTIPRGLAVDEEQSDSETRG
ncbi:MAG: HAMP domain-containing histidine kinase [Chloroflexota bacterium]|nr:HAMP domain-containing histidine kinase [Chloroflexota bacterium]